MILPELGFPEVAKKARERRITAVAIWRGRRRSGDPGPARSCVPPKGSPSSEKAVLLYDSETIGFEGSLKRMHQNGFEALCLLREP